MQLFERIQLGDRSTRRRTSDGYLVAMARCVRSGIQLYSGRECGMADMDVVAGMMWRRGRRKWRNS